MTERMAVAIVSYNTCKHLDACLQSVEADRPHEVVVVDNDSSDGSGEMVRTKYPATRLYQNSTNVGYGAASNQAVTCCNAEYVLLLNSDTRLQPGALRALETYLDSHPDAAIVGPRLVNPDGTLQVSCFPFPSILNTFLFESGGHYLPRYVPFLRERYLQTWSHNYGRVVPWVMGAALTIRRTAFESVRGFDENFFMYYEETDLCYRMKQTKWRVHFAPVTSVVHYGGASTNQNPTSMRIQFYVSMMQFYHRYYSKVYWVQITILIKGIILARLARDVIRLRFDVDVQRRAKLQADIDAWRRVIRLR